MKTSELIDQISKAMSLAQGEMKPASKSTDNPYFKSTYATLSQVMDAIREPFRKNNLCVFQDVCSSENGVSIHTRISHASGQWIEFGPMEIPLSKKDAQAVGSATSYGKRYSLSAAVGVVSDVEDDDGEGAMNRGGKEDKKKTSAFITDDQVNQLEDLASQCDPVYVKKLMDYLKTLTPSITEFKKLTVDMFHKISNGLQSNAKSYQESQNETD